MPPLLWIREAAARWEIVPTDAGRELYIVLTQESTRTVARVAGLVRGRAPGLTRLERRDHAQQFRWRLQSAAVVAGFCARSWAETAQSRSRRAEVRLWWDTLASAMLLFANCSLAGRQSADPLAWIEGGTLMVQAPPVLDTPQAWLLGDLFGRRSGRWRARIRSVDVVKALERSARAVGSDDELARRRLGHVVAVSRALRLLSELTASGDLRSERPDPGLVWIAGQLTTLWVHGKANVVARRSRAGDVRIVYSRDRWSSGPEADAALWPFLAHAGVRRGSDSRWTIQITRESLARGVSWLEGPAPRRMRS